MDENFYSNDGDSFTKTTTDVIDTMPRSGMGLYTGALDGFRRKSVNFVKTLPNKLVGLKDFLKAMLVLFIVIAVIAILVVLFRYYHPRLCSVNRSAAFEHYMEKHEVDLENHIFLLRRNLERGSAQPLFRVGKQDLAALRCRAPADNTGGREGDANVAPKLTSPGNITQSECVLGEGLETKLGQLLTKLTQGGRETFNKNIRTHYRFYSTILRLERPIYSFFAKRDILHEKRFNEKDQYGEPIETVNKAAVNEFRTGFLEPMDELRALLKNMSREVATWDAVYHQNWFTNDMFDFLTSVHMLNLMLNEYHDQITFSYDTRKALTMSMQFNIWTLYFVPYAEKTFTVRIPNIWKGFNETFESQRDLFQQAWSKLGKIFANLPTTMANSGDQEGFSQHDSTDGKSNLAGRFREWGRRKLEEDSTRKRQKMMERDEKEGYTDGEEHAEDVVEPFFGFLKGLVSVGDFFTNVLEIAIVITRTVMNFVTDPVGSTIKLIFIILAVLLGLILTLLHTLLTVIGVSFVIGLLWGWFMAFSISMLLTIVEIVFVAILTVIFSILWFIDLLTGGLIVKLMRCENLPDAWEHRANYAEGNTTERALGVVCCYPCASRFYPVGPLCKRLPAYIPDHCPHQQIISAFRNGKPFGGGVDSPVMFNTFPVKADPSILTKDRDKKEDILLRAFERVKSYLGGCYRNFAKYDYVNRHICHNIDRLPDSSYPPHVKDQMRALCSQAYCEFKPRKKSYRNFTADYRNVRDSENDCLCQTLKSADNRDGSLKEPPSVKENTKDMFRRSLLMFLVVLVLLASTYSLTNAASSLYTR
jgi:ABC-type multidrug transport system fused ATPase/permease subunit